MYTKNIDNTNGNYILLHLFNTFFRYISNFFGSEKMEKKYMHRLDSKPIHGK